MLVASLVFVLDKMKSDSRGKTITSSISVLLTGILNVFAEKPKDGDRKSHSYSMESSPNARSVARGRTVS